MTSTILVRRKARRPRPEWPSGELFLEVPPELPKRSGATFQNALVYVALAGGCTTVTLLLIDAGADLLLRIANVSLALAVVSMVAYQIGRGGTGGTTAQVRPRVARRDYLRYLRAHHEQLSRAARLQRAAATWQSPDPARLWSVVAGSRLWERRHGDADFGVVRVGTGRQPLAVRLVPPEVAPLQALDPVSEDALRRFLDTHSHLPDLPMNISTSMFARVVLTGERDAICGMVRALVMQLAAFHPPTDLRISVCASKDRVPYWEWMKWLPHVLHPTLRDAIGPTRLFADGLTTLERLLGAELTQRPPFSTRQDPTGIPQHVVILDGGGVEPAAILAAEGVAGVCVVDLSGATNWPDDETTLRVEATYERARILDLHGPDDVQWKPDHVGFPQAEALARQLAPLRPSTTGVLGEGPLSAGGTTLPALLGIGGAEAIDPAVLWRPRSPRQRLRVPIGVGEDGRPVELDLKDPAQGGFGPHGLCIGTTGSGKSELLRTLVVSLAMTHAPEALNFLLVDFRGGATFRGVEGLPHVSAVITGLNDDLPLVDRTYEALQGEMVRRQESLRAAGNYASLRDYENAREQGALLEPMPTLVIVFDEFSELLTAKPDFIELFVMIGRLGRSLGVHLLLASQRLEEGKLRGLDTHLSYRIGLRTFSAMESRVVLGVPDAYELPQAPGNGYLKVGTEEMIRFRAAYVSGAYTRAGAGGRAPAGPRAVEQIMPFVAEEVRPRVVADPPQAEPGDGEDSAETFLDVAVRRLAGQGSPARAIWLPPLVESVTLDELLPDLRATPEHGFTTVGWERRGRLHAAVGIVDRPFEQRRDPLVLDLSGAEGNVAVVGAPRSGWATMLRTLIASLALEHTPQEVQFYCLAFGGGTLRSLERLPHVGGVAGRLERERVHRTVADVARLLEDRERYFGEHGIDGIATYRRMRASGQIPGDGFGDVFLVVEDWSTVRNEFENIESAITGLAARGLGYGIHVIAAANRWLEFRMSIRDLFGSRLEFRLGDPYESEVDRKLAANVPEGRPGRGLTREGLHFLAALPRVDGRSSVEDLPDGVRHLVETVAGAWQGPTAPEVRMLPASLRPASLPQVWETGHRVPIGIDEDALAPVLLDFAADPHFVIFGDAECGKSNLLRLIADSIVQRYTPEEARFVFIDYRRSLLMDAADTEHRIGYALSSAATAQLIEDVRAALTERLPPAGLTPQQLRDRSWWNGPDLFVVVDDYEFVATLSGNPLLPLAELIRQAGDIGLHLIIARSINGASRALYDPIIQALREVATPALIMSGPRDEGMLFGDVRPRALPPGRGTLVDRRTGDRLVQTALAPGTDADEPAVERTRPSNT
ncbi:type VII secretion protein EccCa [Actinoallomurus rhizosphaericola]|uniref:type VII secretion protein EccCa n=1 Tax=Actinoallomurus rhizosphaericola TaxID=2952536 RepID=UPI00209208D6|nr:type VII secretion protein EccCa [Actinoallomurus rhizosphaericola]MCO5996336.1 type VII secretion protein EccCa [Actinoallomurus rhizosphaericola]